MSEKTQKALLGGFLEVPEYDESEDLDDVQDEAIFISSSMEIEEEIGLDDFEITYLEFIPDITQQPLRNKIRFCHRMLDRIIEVRDFSFPVFVEFLTENDISEFLKFIEFVEYDNAAFLSHVWQFLDMNPLKIDIEKFCEENVERIIKETEEQIQLHPQNGNINTFLRTYDKEGYTKWFTKSTQRNKVAIVILITERKEKKHESNSDGNNQ